MYRTRGGLFVDAVMVVSGLYATLFTLDAGVLWAASVFGASTLVLFAVSLASIIIPKRES